MTEIFVDSNFFIALFYAQDSLHNKAKTIGMELRKNNLPLVISNLIFSEIVTVLSQRVAISVAIHAGKEIIESPIMRIVHVDEYLHSLSWQIFQEVSRKDMSFVDCSILAVMHAEGIQKLLTFDRENFSSLKRRYSFELF